MDEFVLVCGECQTEPEIVSDGDREAEAVCPSCGQRDTSEAAARIASEHAAHQRSLALQRTIQQAIKGNQFVKFDAQRIPKRGFRWHAKRP